MIVARVWVYIDCLNLYYRALKKRFPSEKWLNLGELPKRVLPGDTIDQVKCFAAAIQPSPFDPTAHMRQGKYFEALRTVANVELIEGRFANRKGRRVLAEAWDMGAFRDVEVMLPEEKRSDVNLAAHLLLDAHHGRYEKALVITNDSDLTTPIQMVVEDFGLPVVLAPPVSAKRVSLELRNAATLVRPIRGAWLKSSQFPNVVKANPRDIHKPESW